MTDAQQRAEFAEQRRRHGWRELNRLRSEGETLRRALGIAPKLTLPVFKSGERRFSQTMLAMFNGKPMSVFDLTILTGQPHRKVSTELNRLAHLGKLKHTARGEYAKP